MIWPSIAYVGLHGGRAELRLHSMVTVSWPIKALCQPGQLNQTCVLVNVLVQLLKCAWRRKTHCMVTVTGVLAYMSWQQHSGLVASPAVYLPGIGGRHGVCTGRWALRGGSTLEGRVQALCEAL